MSEHINNHLIAWCNKSRNNAFDTYKKIYGYLMRLDKIDMEYMINRYSWADIESIIDNQ